MKMIDQIGTSIKINCGKIGDNTDSIKTKVSPMPYPTM